MGVCNSFAGKALKNSPPSPNPPWRIPEVLFPYEEAGIPSCAPLSNLSTIFSSKSPPVSAF